VKDAVMPGPLDDERIRFFLRHRDDIIEWARIEREVQAAVREVLAGLQPQVEDKLAAADPHVTTSRWDRPPWERIRVHRPGWPTDLGLVLEWETRVNPFGGLLPKLGVLWTADVPARSSFATAAAGSALPGLGYGALDRVWPVGQRVKPSRDWWQNIDSWTGDIVTALVELWPRVAPMLDLALDGQDPGRPDIAGFPGGHDQRLES